MVSDSVSRAANPIFLQCDAIDFADSSKQYLIEMAPTTAFVKKLASNDKSVRDQSFDTLKKYLAARNSKKLTPLDFEKLWKGLYYAMWFCDKPKPQENLAESIGELYSSFIPSESFIPFLEAFWKIINKEWPNIDHWRIDKNLLMVRRILRHSFKFLQKNNWSIDEEGENTLLKQFTNVIYEKVLSGDKTIPLALLYHITDIYLDELEIVIFADLSGLQEELDNIEDEESEEFKTKRQELYKKKFEIVDDIPVLKLIEPFEKIPEIPTTKTLWTKAKSEVLQDERLKLWGVVPDDDEEETKEDENEEKEDEEEEEEWKGF